MSELTHLFAFSDHVGRTISKYFELPRELEYLHEIGDDVSPRQYVRQLLLPVQTPPKTDVHVYLQALIGLSGPVLDACEASTRICSAKPRARTVGASSSLIHAARDLAHESYHFCERIKEHASSLRLVHRDMDCAKMHVAAVSRALRNFETPNKRILKYRNFLVHGPKGRVDEFAELRLAELGGFALHDNLWCEHEAVFDECKQDWAAMAKSLLSSMETALARIQFENEKIIDLGGLTFCAQLPAPT